MKKQFLIFIVFTSMAIFSAVAARPVFGRPLGPNSAQSSPQTSDSTPVPRKLWERVEITLTGGLGISITKWTTLHYTQSGTTTDGRVTAANKIKTTSAADTFAGAAATFFLPSGVGIQAGFGYLKAGLTSATRFELRASGGMPSAYTDDEQGMGELTAVPIYICLLNKFDFSLKNNLVHAYTSIGPVIFLNSILTETRAGAALIQDGKMDGFKIPVAVADTTWIAFGATAAVGFDVHLSTSLALTLEARYYYAPRKNFSWTWTQGVYDGVFRNITGLNFNGESAAENERNMTPLTINPSFVQIAGGIKIIF